jgi:RNA polymerase sigma factor (sigma-70 family)
VTEQDFLAEQFEANRAHLRAVAYRMLGSATEADDAVQETWLRLSRSDPDAIRNLGGWLTTAVARTCLDMLRVRTARREEELDDERRERIDATPGATHGDATNPEHQVVLADSLGLALLVVLETLTPAERLAFVLHDLFAVPFEEIAPIVERSPAAARQLASRARRRVQGARSDADSNADVSGHRAIVDAFLAAAHDGDLAGLLALLDPDVVVRADAVALAGGAMHGIHGAQAVAATFSGRAQTARRATVDGAPGAAWGPAGKPRVAFAFTIRAGLIVAIDFLSDPERLAGVVLIGR